MRMRGRVMLGCVCTLSVCASGFAEEWPQWRGPDRDGVVTATGPRAWPEKLTERWKVPVGEGYSSPILAGGRIFQFTRQGSEEVAMSLDPATGKILWRRSYTAPYEPNSATLRHGLGPRSTPVYYEGKLYTFGVAGVLTAFEAGTGRVLWQKSYAGQFKAGYPMFGTSMSPIAEDGLVVALVGTNEDGAIVAYDAASGEQKWMWKGDGPAYASPVVVELEGVKQVVSLTEKYVVGLALGSGERLWQVDFPERSGMNIPSPLVLDRRIVVASTRGTFAIEPAKSGASWVVKTDWENSMIPMRFSSPVRKGDLLFGYTNRNSGMFFCADVASGKTLWTSGPRQGDNATVFLLGEHLLLLKNDAELIVARAAGDAFEPVRQYEVANSETYANPLVLDGGIVIKDKENLALLGWE